MKNDDTQEEQEVLQAGPLDNMEKVDPMTAKELQDYLEALPPDQQEAHRQRAERSAWRMVEAFDPGDAEESMVEAFNNTAQAVSRLAAELDAALSDAMHSEADALRAALESLRESLFGMNEKMLEAQKNVMAFCDSETFNKLSDILPGFREWYNAFMDCEIFDISPGQLICLGDFTEEAQSLLPFIQKEVEGRIKRGADQLTAAEFFRDTDPDTGEPVESIYGRVRQRASRALSVGAHRAKEIRYPVDKVNSVVWGLLQENTHGQMTLNVKAEPNKSHNPVNIIYSINFDDIKSGSLILKRLTSYDKRVYVAIGALTSAGNFYCTLSMIYQAMGYRGEPGKADREKISKSLTKMGARIYIDNLQEISAGYKYPKFKYDGDLLPFERLTPDDVDILINGKPAEEYIHIFREPPLLTFARERNQVTTIDIELLQTPLSKTEQNLAIEDYCIERIAQYKRQGKKILLSTLCERCNISTRKQKERLPRKLALLFDYYQERGAIEGYTLTKDAIIFTPAKKSLPV